MTLVDSLSNLEELMSKSCDVCGRDDQDFWYCLTNRKAEVLKRLCMSCSTKYLAPKTAESFT
jgi:hypothetical protein